ncbi:MAG: amidohydrolase family protein [Actinomycetes bacterium]
MNVQSAASSANQTAAATPAVTATVPEIGSAVPRILDYASSIDKPAAARAASTAISPGWAALESAISVWLNSRGDGAAEGPFAWAALAFARRHSDGTAVSVNPSATTSGEPATAALQPTQQVFPIADLGSGLYQISDPAALSEIFGRSGILGHISLGPIGDGLPETSGISFDFTASELGIRVNGADYTILQPTRAFPVDTLEDAEKSLLLSTSPYAYNHDTAGQSITDPITGFYQVPVAKGDVFEFWYTAPSGNKVYSSASPNRFTLSDSGSYGTLKVNADALLNSEGDPLFTTYALSTFTQKVLGGTRYTVRMSSASEQKNKLKIYTVDDAAGSIDGVLPWEEGYADLAAARVVKSYNSPGFLKRSKFDNLKLCSDAYIASYLQKPDGTKLFPWSEANPNGTDSVIRVSDKAFAYDDGSGGTVKDFQDLIFSIQDKASANSADLIITAKVVTSSNWLSKVNQTANAIAIKDGVIIGLGRKWQLLNSFKGAATVVEQRDQSYLFPGFVDPHEHIFTLGSYALMPSNANLTWPGNPGSSYTYENITKVMIQKLAAFQTQHQGEPKAWFGAFGLDPSTLGNADGSKPTDSLSTIYQEAFAIPPKELVTATPGYGDGQTFLNWLTYIGQEADKIAPGSSARPVAIFYGNGHGIATNAPGVDELVKLDQLDPSLNFATLQQFNTDLNGGQPSYLTDAIGGYFLRDGEYARTGYFTGLAVEPSAIAPLTELFNVSRLGDVYGQMGTNLQAQAFNHASVGVTATNDKSFGSLTDSPTHDVKLEGFLQSSGYQPIRLLGDPLANLIFDGKNQIKPGFTLTPFQGNLSTAPEAVKFILDGSDQALTGYMPADNPYIVMGNSAASYNPAFVLFQETASGWLPVGMRDFPYAPAPGTGPVNDSLNVQAQALWNLGWGLHTHATGQQATTAAIDVYKQLFKQSGSKAKASPPQILSMEHLPFATNQQLRDLAKIGGFASFTHTHLQRAYQFGWNGESFQGTGILGQKRGNGIVPALTALFDGITVSMHSDFPISWVGSLTPDLDPSQTFTQGPLDMMAELTNRKLTSITKSANNPTTTVNPWQRLSRREAFLAVSLSAAKNMSFDPWIGSLAVGKLADMTLLDRNILSPFTPLQYATPAQSGVNVLETWVGGNSVYQA